MPRTINVRRAGSIPVFSKAFERVTFEKSVASVDAVAVPGAPRCQARGILRTTWRFTIAVACALLLVAFGPKVFAEPASPGDPGHSRDVAEAPITDSLGDVLPKGALMRFGTVRFRPASGVADLALAPDQKVLITFGKELIAWDTADGKELWRKNVPDVHPRRRLRIANARVRCRRQEVLHCRPRRGRGRVAARRRMPANRGEIAPRPRRRSHSARNDRRMPRDRRRGQWRVVRRRHQSGRGRISCRWRGGVSPRERGQGRPDRQRQGKRKCRRQ